MKSWILIAALAVGVPCVASVRTYAADATTAKAAETETEVDVKLADCPAAVQATITKAVGTGTITSIQMETEDGVTTYKAKATVDGKNVKIKVAADGTLASTKPDAAKTEDDDDKDEPKK